jgi:hypothetical protein
VNSQSDVARGSGGTKGKGDNGSFDATGVVVGFVPSYTFPFQADYTAAPRASRVALRADSVSQIGPFAAPGLINTPAIIRQRTRKERAFLVLSSALTEGRVQARGQTVSGVADLACEYAFAAARRGLPDRQRRRYGPTETRSMRWYSALLHVWLTW